ncbi:MAG: DNA polymerase-3 subunit delta [Verrucomicrobiales bacterium]|jgi:DNA polymerase-3 subunit delta
MAIKKKAATKSKAAPNLFAVLGNDEALVKEEALKLCNKLSAPDAGDFGNDVIDGVSDNSAHAAQIINLTVQALQTMPFFGGEKVVWLKSANFLGDSVTGKSAATLDALEGLGDVLEEGVPDGVKFILSATEIYKVRRFYKRLVKVANVEVHDMLDTSKQGWEQQVMRMVESRGRELGLEFDREALELFVMLSGEATRQIEGELIKLDLFLGKERRRVEVVDVKQLVSQSREGIVFELGNAIGKRDLHYALEMIDQLMGQGESAIGILLAAVVPKVRSLLNAKDLIARFRLPGGNYRNFEGAINQLPGAETAHLSRKKDGGISCYPLFLAADETRAYSIGELKDGLAECLAANKSLVTSGLDHKLVLTRLVVRLLTKRKVSAA